MVQVVEKHNIVFKGSDDISRYLAKRILRGLRLTTKAAVKSLEITGHAPVVQGVGR
jgi:hypothetical protein